MPIYRALQIRHGPLCYRHRGLWHAIRMTWTAQFQMPRRTGCTYDLLISYTIRFKGLLNPMARLSVSAARCISGLKCAMFYHPFASSLRIDLSRLVRRSFPTRVNSHVQPSAYVSNCSAHLSANPGVLRTATHNLEAEDVYPPPPLFASAYQSRYSCSAS